MPCETLGPMPKKVSRERCAIVSGCQTGMARSMYLHERRLGEVDVGNEGLHCVSKRLYRPAASDLGTMVGSVLQVVLAMVQCCLR